MAQKMFIMKERLYVQLEVEVQNMDEDYTEIFLVPADDTEKANKIESMLHEGYSVDEVLEEFPDVFYMCRVYDDRIERDLNLDKGGKI